MTTFLIILGSLIVYIAGIFLSIYLIHRFNLYENKGEDKNANKEIAHMSLVWPVLWSLHLLYVLGKGIWMVLKYIFVSPTTIFIKTSEKISEYFDEKEKFKEENKEAIQRERKINKVLR